ncbi:hypothetical protein [Geobacter argillaceus]|uniref:Uncharacterized protein n=1 Tax=Geobacter argillaceus TaxID=345631 RepID=A0A562W929_9BACT|nr:hypothetical protein [Geobacter argillaceus]TWJ26511.1 hypothetical protein JN12_01219 [Geobacter argillaceus]
MSAWIRTITVTLLLLLVASASMADTMAPGENTRWRKRSGAPEPATKEEKLAVELIAKQEQLLQRGRYTVQYDGERGEYAQVSVRLTGGDGDVDTIRRFLVKDSRIVAYADPVYEQAPRKIDPRRRENALMIARQTRAGEAPNRPGIYNGFMYTAEIDGCKAIVTERNTEREVVETYEFELCQ